MKWIPVTESLPDEFDEKYKITKPYLVYIDNPFFHNGNYHVSYLMKSDLGNHWVGIEPNVSHRWDNMPNVTHWCELPNPPQK